MSDEAGARRKWFEAYCRRMERDAVRKESKEGARFACPCCGYPTLEARGEYEICHLCWWEDDGQDESHADEVWGGPNHQYSLSHARRNFKDHLTKYDRGRDTRVSGEDPPLVVRSKRTLMSAYDALRTEVDPERLEALWSSVRTAERRLWAAESRRIRNAVKKDAKKRPRKRR